MATEPEAGDEIVTFEDADGNEISNDPRWHAKQVMAATGVNVDDLQAQIAKLTAERDAALDAAHTSGSQAGDAGDASSDDDDKTSDDGDEYDALNGADLKKLAGDRGVDIAGMKKVGEVREALRAADKAAAE